MAYQQAFDDGGADALAPWFQDDRHPTDMSTYMAACMEYGLIFGVDPATITSHPAAVSDADAVTMRSYASQALKGFTNIVDHTAATVRYQAVGFDQYGKEMDAPADLVYALTDGGALDANHVFKSNGTEGTYTVTAKNDTYDLSATVKVAHAETQVVTEFQSDGYCCRCYTARSVAHRPPDLCSPHGRFLRCFTEPDNVCWWHQSAF